MRKQRFGVAHKEKIKKTKGKRRCSDTDCNTDSAYPSYEPHWHPGYECPGGTAGGPPADSDLRHGVQRRDGARGDSQGAGAGGQVYYVYNRVNNIDEVANHVAALVPEANVVFAHGQMHEHELEKIMLDFVEGNIDVLVSTTIIETDWTFRMRTRSSSTTPTGWGCRSSTKIRGRVGRSGRTSYAFLMYRRDKLLREEAEKRLQAIREFTELGSGIKIAMRDLELRGAGNLLGAEQHGHMQAVG